MASLGSIYSITWSWYQTKNPATLHQLLFLLSKNSSSIGSRSCLIYHFRKTYINAWKYYTSLKKNPGGSPRRHSQPKQEQILKIKTRFVWDCKGRNLFYIPKIYFEIFFLLFSTNKTRPSQAGCKDNKHLPTPQVPTILYFTLKT